jgi:hypothetical protein
VELPCGVAMERTGQLHDLLASDLHLASLAHAGTDYAMVSESHSEKAKIPAGFSDYYPL